MTLIYIQYPKRQTSITNRYLQIVCGDGKREAGEECDDTNLTPGDGCSVTCTIEADYICTGGTPITADTCLLCTGGTSPDATKTSCTVQCGDTKLHATEN